MLASSSTVVISSTGMTPKGLDAALILSGGSTTYEEDLKEKMNYNFVPMP
jgi:hypothetical protein